MKKSWEIKPKIYSSRTQQFYLFELRNKYLVSNFFVAFQKFKKIEGISLTAQDAKVPPLLYSLKQVELASKVFCERKVNKVFV